MHAQVHVSTDQCIWTTVQKHDICMHIWYAGRRKHSASGGQQTKTLFHEGAQSNDSSWPFPSDSLFVSGDLNHRNAGGPPMTASWSVSEGATTGEVKSWSEKDQTRKWWNWGKRLRKVQLVICTCLPANCLQWAAFVQWPMQLEWRLLSKSSCRAPDKRIKNYDIF